MLSTNQRQQRQMGGGRKPPLHLPHGGREGRGGLMSQFHYDNGARAVGMVSIVRSHCASADREKLHHILSQSLLILSYKRVGGLTVF